MDYYHNSERFCIKDNLGNVWVNNAYLNLGGDNKLVNYRDNVNPPDVLKEEYQNDETFDIVKYEDNSHPCSDIILGNNGKLYYQNYENRSGKIDLTGVTDFYMVKDDYRYSSPYEYYEVYYLAFASDGVYLIKEYTIYNFNTGKIYSYSITKTQVTTSVMKKVYESYVSSDIYTLDENGNIWRFKSTNVHECLTTDNSDYALYGIKIKDFYFGNTIRYAIDENDNLYRWTTAAGEPTLFTQYDNIIATYYGEATNENRIKFLEEGIPSIIKKDDGIFNVNCDYTNDTLTYTPFKFTDEKTVGGLGNINQVVGENEVQTEEGKIYRITPEGTSSYTIEETTTTTLFATPEIQEIQIEGANIVKQTKYKALDDEGNLYVWDDYTGISNTFEGVLCLTDEQYYVAPIYTRSNGWSVIKNQF